MPRVHAGRPAQTVFAVAIEHESGAVDAVRRVLGGLHCRVDARCRLSSRALARLGVGPGEAKAI